ncbi:MAG: leucine-rich repeat domain-containing protein [Pseudonocardiaceae bacterium]
MEIDDLRWASRQGRLDLTHRGLTTLPPEITQLTSLHTLNLSFNQLTTLPPEINQLINLQALYLRDNHLTSLPPEINQLINLQELYLRDNQLIVLPPGLAPLLRNGLRLDLIGNPLPHPFPELIGRGSDALAAYLASLDDGVAQFEAKVLLVGEGNVGKTSLVASLLAVPRSWRTVRPPMASRSIP